MSFDAAFKRAVLKLILAGVALAAALWIAQWPVLALAAGLPAHNVTALLLLGFLGGLYGRKFWKSG